MMLLNKKIADNTKLNSLALRLRQKRFELFKNLISNIPKPLKILDVGGTEMFWKMMAFTENNGIDIVLFNRAKIQTSFQNFTSIVGDARDMSQFGNGEYDVVFSNSLIEHIGSYDEQKKVADEIIRIGKRYFIQTPNYYFPIEPHFLFPFFQYLPFGLKTFLLCHLNLGWYKKINDCQEAVQVVGSIRLLKEHELRQLFPNAQIYKEKVLGLTKSFILYGGW